MTAFCQRLTAASAFQRVITGVILLTGVFVGLETNAALVAQIGPWLRFADSVVLGVFLVELALRLGAHEIREALAGVGDASFG